MKKDLGVIDSMIQDKEPEQEQTKIEAPAASTGTASEAVRPKGRPREDEYEARSFRVKRALFAKMKIIAAREGIMQKDILELALEDAIAKYEAKYGVIDISQATGKKANVRELF